MACSWHVWIRVEGVTEASLTSDVIVACLFLHSWRGLAGLTPSAFSEGARKFGGAAEPPHEAGLRSRQASEAVSAQVQFDATSRLEFHVRWSGWTRPPKKGGWQADKMICKGSRGGLETP